MGSDWDHLDVLVRVYCGGVSAVGESGGAEDDYAWDGKGMCDSFGFWFVIKANRYGLGCVRERKWKACGADTSSSMNV